MRAFSVRAANQQKKEKENFVLRVSNGVNFALINHNQWFDRFFLFILCVCKVKVQLCNLGFGVLHKKLEKESCLHVFVNSDSIYVIAPFLYMVLFGNNHY